MKHLTVDQIIDFVSITKLDNESIELFATVNGHIRQCEKCLELVRAFQNIYDEFCRLNTTDGFKDFVSKTVLSKDKDNTIEDSLVLEELDAFR